MCGARQSRQDLCTPLLVFGATRLALALVVWAGQVLLPLSSAPGVWLAFPRQLVLDGWVRWDAGWYLLVAQQGYRFDASEPTLTPTVLPLFPALIRLASLVIPDLVLAGLIVANLAFAAALVIMYQAAQRRFGAPIAVRSILFLSLFPFAFLFSAAYAESLTLLLAVGTFSLMERERPFAAAFVAALATLASPAGLLLWPALIVWHVPRLIRRSHSPGSAATLALPLLAAGALGAYLSIGIGEPIEIVAATMLGSTRYGLLGGGMALGDQVSEDIVRFWPVLGLGTLLGAVTLGAAAYAVRLLGMPHAAFAALAVLVPALLGFDALGRSLAVAFPVCLVLAYLCRSQLSESLLVVCFSVFLGLLCLLYAGWYPAVQAGTAITPAREQMGQVIRGAGRQASASAAALDVELPNVVRFLGYDSPGRVAPGQFSFQLDLQTLRPTTLTYVVSVHLNDQSGRSWATADQLLVGATSWESGLTAGAVTRLPVVVTVDPAVPSGIYMAELLVFDHDLARLPLVDSETGRDKQVTLGQIAILRQEDSPDPGDLTLQHATDAALGGQFALRGYDLSSPPAFPGGKLTVTLYWEGLSKPEFDYTAFVQLLDERGKLVAQSDAYPMGGRYPTSKWRPGEVVRDVHEIAMPPTAIPPGPLRLIAGMYRLETMERLIASDRSGARLGDHVTLGPVQGGEH